MLNELAAYAIEQYEGAARGMPQAVMKWAQDFIANVKTFLADLGVEFNTLTAADLSAMSRRFLRQQASVVKDSLTTARNGEWQDASAYSRTGKTGRGGIRQNAAIDATNDSTMVFTTLAQFDDAFQQPTPRSQTVESITREIDTAYKARALNARETQIHNPAPGVKMWEIVTPKGRHG